MNKEKEILKINIECCSKDNNIPNLYKKKSAKIYLLFFNFFNSIYYFNNLLMNLNLFYFFKPFYKNIKIKIISFVNYYFINTNFNIFTNKKNKINLNKYRRIFVNSFRRYVLKLFRKTCKMVIKFNTVKMFKIWFTNRINRINANLNIINFSNIYLYCSEIVNCIFYFLYRINFIYIIKLNNLYIYFNNILKTQKININFFIYNLKKQKYNNNSNIKIIIKFLKMFSNLIYNNHNKLFIKKELFNIINQEYFDYMSYIKNKYVKKFIYLYNVYTNNNNIKFKTYWNFSFVFKKKKKKKEKKSIYLKQRFNFFYIINNLINKYIFFIFIHWVNLFFIECLSELKLDDNILFMENNKKLSIATIFNLYYEKKKYRRRGVQLWKVPKLCYLVYFKPTKFLLYFNKGLNKSK